MYVTLLASRTGVDFPSLQECRYSAARHDSAKRSTVIIIVYHSGPARCQWLFWNTHIFIFQTHGNDSHARPRHRTSIKTIRSFATFVTKPPIFNSLIRLLSFNPSYRSRGSATSILTRCAEKPDWIPRFVRAFHCVHQANDNVAWRDRAFLHQGHDEIAVLFISLHSLSFSCFSDAQMKGKRIAEG